jgi:hypothetical protein
MWPAPCSTARTASSRLAITAGKNRLRPSVSTNGLPFSGDHALSFAAQRPRQDRLCTEQIPHADGTRKIRAEEQLARFEQFFGGCRELLYAGDALAAGKLHDRDREEGAAAFKLPTAPRKPDLSPAALARMAERPVRAWQIAHETFERAPRAAPAQKLQRLLGPGKYGFRNLFRFRAAADEGAAGLAVEI